MDVQIKSWCHPVGMMRALCPLLLRIPVMRQLLDVVYQAVELPLRINLALSPECEPVQLLVVPDVTEHQFHRGKASPVLRLPFRVVDAPSFCR